MLEDIKEQELSNKDWTRTVYEILGKNCRFESWKTYNAIMEDLSWTKKWSQGLNYKRVEILALRSQAKLATIAWG